MAIRSSARLASDDPSSTARRYQARAVGVVRDDADGIAYGNGALIEGAGERQRRLRVAPVRQDLERTPGISDISGLQQVPAALEQKRDLLAAQRFGTRHG